MPDPLSIAIVTGSASRLAGGLFNSVRRSAQSLSAAGHDVSVFALADEHIDEDLAAWAPLTPVVVGTVGPRRLAFAPALGRALAVKRFDVVHQHGIWQAFSRTVAAHARHRSIPTMISPRGMLDPWAVAHAAWKKKIAGALFEDANLSRAACLHALNPSEAASIRAYGLTNPVATIPNGTDLPVDVPPPPPPAWWPTQEGGGRVLLFIGRIHAKKGVVELTEAFARVVAGMPEEVAARWYVVIAGWDDGGHQTELAAAIARHGLWGRVVLPGPLYGADKQAALANADAFVLPSYSEGLPMSVLEAWAWRLPVLMTGACNLPDGFAANAAVHIETDPDALAATLAETFARSPEDLAAIGLRGRRHVASHYTWDRIAAAHEAVYRWMVAGCADDMRPVYVS